MKFGKKSIDEIILIVAEAYIMLPIIFFLWGWTKILVAITGTLIIAALAFFVYKACCDEEKAIKLCTKENLYFWIITGGTALVWIYLSGIGALAYQNGDFWARNPIYYDLSTCSWPVVYDFSSQSDVVKQLCGDGTAAFVYYYAWWLPPAFISKLLCLGELGRNITLFIWSWLGVILVIYLLCRKMNSCKWYIPVILVFFSGLDAIPYWMENDFFETFPWKEHIEFWARFFQYSSNTTQLFWVFNQALPIWLLMILMLQLNNSSYSASVAALSFAYSPWATFGMIPYAVYDSLKSRKNIKDALNIINIATVFLMMSVFGMFYLGVAGNGGEIGLIFLLKKGMEKMVLANYLSFIFFEFLIFFFVVGKKSVDAKYYWITLVELLIFPLFIVRDNNFIMRGSIPALFMLMYYVLSFLAGRGKDIIGEKEYGLRKKILVAVLCLGMLTPLAEINRSITITSAGGKTIEDPVGSFADMKTEEEWRIQVIREQFFAYDYDRMFAFKYPSK